MRGHKFIIFIFFLLNVSQAFSYEIVSWNIQKGLNPHWNQYIMQNAQVSYWGLQEATSQPDVLGFLSTVLNVEYNPAWKNAKKSTGTLNAHKFSTLGLYSIVTKVLEPLVNTPKSFIVSDFDWGCHDIVRVVNVHMINFLLGNGYQAHLDQVYEYIWDHKGPLIILGDFNNWNRGRTKMLLKWVKSLGLNFAHNGNNTLRGLDHIFYRDLVLHNFKISQVRLSDHKPVHAEFSCYLSNNQQEENTFKSL